MDNSYFDIMSISNNFLNSEAIVFKGGETCDVKKYYSILSEFPSKLGNISVKKVFQMAILAHFSKTVSALIEKANKLGKLDDADILKIYLAANDVTVLATYLDREVLKLIKHDYDKFVAIFKKIYNKQIIDFDILYKNPNTAGLLMFAADTVGYEFLSEKDKWILLKVKCLFDENILYDKYIAKTPGYFMFLKDYKYSYMLDAAKYNGILWDEVTNDYINSVIRLDYIEKFIEGDENSSDELHRFFANVLLVDNFDYANYLMIRPGYSGFGLDDETLSLLGEDYQRYKAEHGSSIYGNMSEADAAKKLMNAIDDVLNDNIDGLDPFGDAFLKPDKVIDVGMYYKRYAEKGEEVEEVESVEDEAGDIQSEALNEAETANSEEVMEEGDGFDESPAEDEIDASNGYDDTPSEEYEEVGPLEEEIEEPELDESQIPEGAFEGGEDEC